MIKGRKIKYRITEAWPIYLFRLTGSDDFEWEEFYIIGPGSKKEHEQLRKTHASCLDNFELIDFVYDADGDEGIHAQVRRVSDKKIFILPLDYLKVKPRKSKNFV